VKLENSGEKALAKGSEKKKKKKKKKTPHTSWRGGGGVFVGGPRKGCVRALGARSRGGGEESRLGPDNNGSVVKSGGKGECGYEIKIQVEEGLGGGGAERDFEKEGTESLSPA